jgi:hypothetical protein
VSFRDVLYGYPSRTFPFILECYSCSDSICLGSVSLSPYKVALHRSYPEQGIAPRGPTPPDIWTFFDGLLKGAFGTGDSTRGNCVTKPPDKTLNKE